MALSFMADSNFWLPWPAALVGMLTSVLLEQIMQPRPPLRRLLSAWAVHVGIWLILHGFLTLVLGRTWFAMALGLAALLTVVLVNNAKYKALREPFVFQDYEYFTDAIRYPRLYIPFLGWWKFLLATIAFIGAVAIGWWLEAVPNSRWNLSGPLGGVVLQCMLGAILLVVGSRRRLNLGLDVHHDLMALGLLAYLWRYALMGRHLPTVVSHFSNVNLNHSDPNKKRFDNFKSKNLPDLVAVQSESFFDARQLYCDIYPRILDQLDALQSQAFLSGSMRVPAWGANTVRTEFAFLTGIDNQHLSIHQFNPYRAIASGWQVVSFVQHLKLLGYKTICIHPYPADFYLRRKVYPLLGFDEFLDIQKFSSSQRYGPYIGDSAVTQKILDVLRQEARSNQPIFVFAITMENHGPLHLEQVATEEVGKLYSKAPPAGCDDLTIYLRHLRNANKMIGDLRTALEASSKPTSLCWYGDHVPIMPTVYAAFGQPSGLVPYACWSNSAAKALYSVTKASNQNDETLSAHELSRKWLEGVGLWQQHAN